MQQTANYNLNLPEGTDVVNPLVDYNPNFTIIDGAMKANADRTVGRATCIKSGTTHAVTRSNPDSPIINFTATGDWNTGDTMTIDGDLVSVYLSDGTAPLTGAYVINTEVIAAINGSRVTLYTGSGAVTSIDVDYDNTSSGLTATNAQAAIDEVAGEIGDLSSLTTSDKSSVVDAINEIASNAGGSVSVTGDGVKTERTLLNELFALVDFSKLSPKSKFVSGNNIYNAFNITPTMYRFSFNFVDSGAVRSGCVDIKSANSNSFYSAGVTVKDGSTSVLSVGQNLTIYY